MSTASPRSTPASERDAVAHLTSSKSPAPRLLQRSCLGCNSKKIRCDRREPCSACTRSGRHCEFPPPGSRTRRPKKTIIAEMSSRLADLEKTLVKGSRDSAATSSVAGQPSSALYSQAATPRSDASRGDILVQNGSASQYFNEILISNVIKEAQCDESVLTPQASPPGPPTAYPINALGILSSPTLSLKPTTLLPPKHQAVKLWNLFTEPVQACTGLKLLHVPTDEVKVFSVIEAPSKAPLEDVALCFAIFFSSAVFLDPEESERTLGKDKNAALHQFKLGLEQAFAHGDFLDRPTISGLHALAVYLAALRIHNRGKGIWILNGLAIRIAQSLGLDRDGSRLGLSPFQSEIRRRLWWHLLCRDARSGEDYGLVSNNSPLLLSDVEAPANVNDTDLDPDMKEPPVPRRGWTPMTFALSNIELGQTMEKLASIAAASTPSSPPSEAVRLQILQDARARVDAWIALCNPVVPQQLLTRHCTLFLLRKTSFVTKLQWILLRQRAGSQEQFATEENLEEALETLKLKSSMEDGLLSAFRWAIRAYPQYSVTMYVLLHLCVKPEGPRVALAWQAIEDFFAGEVQDGDNVGFGPKLSVLAALREKAMAVREKVQHRRPGPVLKDRGQDVVAGSNASVSEGASHSVDRDGNGIGDEFGLDMNMDDWPDWASLVHDFQLDASDVFLQ